MNNLLIKTHELWLEVLMASFMTQNGESKRVLNHFSDILFRHFTWIEKSLIDSNIDYDYNRNQIPIKVENFKDIISDISNNITQLELDLNNLNDEALKSRIQTDLYYIKHTIEQMPNEPVSAFNAKRVYKDYDLSKEATDAFTLFLFEESYKEYELIMIYNYLKAHSNDDYLNKIFQILIDESMFHFKSFGEMMAQMGILAVPRVIHKSLYQVEDVVKFLEDGIEEELAAKVQCLELSSAVAKDSQELAKFFDFINFQENYHIELMQDALKHYLALKDANE